MGHITATFAQDAFRFRNDDGSETSATWKASTDTDISAQMDGNYPFRLRILTQETAGGSENNTDISIQYRKNGGTWTNVTDTSSNVQFRSSATVTDGTSTTDQLTGSGSFLAGSFVASESTTPNISFNGNDHTENEFSLTVVDADVSQDDTLEFRTLIDGNTYTYNVTPTITVSYNNPPSTPTLSSPTDNATSIDLTPELQFSTTDPESDDIRYQVQIDTVNTFDSGSTLDKTSGTDAGFANETNGGDTDPFNSGDTISYTVQSGDELSYGTEYFWRVRATDPNGSGSFSNWSSVRSFTTATLTTDSIQNELKYVVNQPPTVTLNSVS